MYSEFIPGRKNITEVLLYMLRIAVLLTVTLPTVPTYYYINLKGTYLWGCTFFRLQLDIRLPRLLPQI